MPLTIAADGGVEITGGQRAYVGPIHIVDRMGKRYATALCGTRFVPASTAKHLFAVDDLLSHEPLNGDCPECIAAMQAEVHSKLQEANEPCTTS